MLTDGRRPPWVGHSTDRSNSLEESVQLGSVRYKEGSVAAHICIAALAFGRVSSDPIMVDLSKSKGEIMEYQARCHCGRVRFSFYCPEIKKGVRCDCSLCIRRGAVLSSGYISTAEFTPHHDPEDLGVYLWNERVLSNYFCKHCGIFTYIGDGENAKDGYRVNLGCVEGLDPFALEISMIDGKTLPVIKGDD
jgi:hypothetical protein